MQEMFTDDQWLLRFDPGEEVIQGLTDFCLAHEIINARIEGIGAARRIETGLFNADDRNYIRKVFEGEYEIASLLGNVTRKDGDIFVHAHICFGNSDMRAYAGHCFACTISATCEIFLRPLSSRVERTRKDDLGLHTMDLQ